MNNRIEKLSTHSMARLKLQIPPTYNCCMSNKSNHILCGDIVNTVILCSNLLTKMCQTNQNLTNDKQQNT